MQCSLTAQQGNLEATLGKGGTKDMVGKLLPEREGEGMTEVVQDMGIELIGPRPRDLGGEKTEEMYKRTLGAQSEDMEHGVGGGGVRSEGRGDVVEGSQATPEGQKFLVEERRRVIRVTARESKIRVRIIIPGTLLEREATERDSRGRGVREREKRAKGRGDVSTGAPGSSFRKVNLKARGKEKVTKLTERLGGLISRDLEKNVVSKSGGSPNPRADCIERGQRGSQANAKCKGTEGISLGYAPFRREGDEGPLRGV